MSAIQQLFDSNSDPTGDFIAKAKERHGDTYDYSLTVINGKSSHQKVIIICRTHGPFRKAVFAHLTNGNGCPHCADRKRGRFVGVAIEAEAREAFLAMAARMHGDRYDYSKTKFKNLKENSKLTVICKIHGVFHPTLSAHRQGNGNCPECFKENTEARIRNMTEVTRASVLKTFIEKARAVHGNNYDYSEIDANYFGAKTKSGGSYKAIPVPVICPLHGKFNTFRKHHLLGEGCPKCATIVATPVGKLRGVLRKLNSKPKVKRSKTWPTKRKTRSTRSGKV